MPSKMKSTITLAELIPCLSFRFARNRNYCRLQLDITFHVSIKLCCQRKTSLFSNHTSCLYMQFILIVLLTNIKLFRLCNCVMTKCRKNGYFILSFIWRTTMSCIPPHWLVSNPFILYLMSSASCSSDEEKLCWKKKN